MTGQRAAKVTHAPLAEEAAAHEATHRGPAAPTFDARRRQDLVLRAAQEGRLEGAPAGTVALRVGLLVAVVAGCAMAWAALAALVGRMLG